MKTASNRTSTSAAVGTALLLSAFLVVGQSPFVEVLETGDLGHLAADSGASWGDFDNDGDMDLYVPNWERRLNYLYRNDGDGVFNAMGEDEIGDLASDDGDTPMGVWADIDNDGDLDLYLANRTSGRDLIYLNNGDGQFDRHMPLAFASPAHASDCASLFDYDQDGLLDVFVTTWPSSGPGVDALYHNEGDLVFSSMGAFTPETEGLLGFWGDIDEDGDYDIIVGDFNNSRASHFHLNQAAQNAPSEFVVSTTFPNGSTLPNRLSDADWGDFDNDGDLDLLAGHSTHSGCGLFRNDGGGTYTKIDIALQGNLRSGTVVWVDVDNDGRLDMLVETWDTSKGNRGLAYSYLKNLGGESFEESVVVSGVDFLGELHLPNPGDFDNDGDMDFFLVVSTESGNPDQLWRNQSKDNHWLKLVLKGTVSNASAIGAIVRVRATVGGAQTWQMRQIFAGGKYLAQPDPRPNFGLGDATVADVVRIEWPSGLVQELTNIAADQIHTVVEPVRLNLDTPDQLSWPFSRAFMSELESAPTVDGPWTPTAEPVQTDGNRKSIAIQANVSRRFYRLRSVPPVPLLPNPDPDKLVWIPPGIFMMGSPGTEPEREALVLPTGYGDETLHQVTLTRGFWMAKHETTQEDYTAVMGSNPSAFSGVNLPVESVTWHESVAYCEQLTSRELAAGRLPEGYVYRLPTEAEWEYACRAGTSTAFHLGDELRSGEANFDGTREYSVTDGGTVANPLGIAAGQTLSVSRRSSRPNAWAFTICLEMSENGAQIASIIIPPALSQTRPLPVQRTIGVRWNEADIGEHREPIAAAPTGISTAPTTGTAITAFA